MALVNELTKPDRAARPAFVKVWDRFIRVFHWSLAALFVIAWISSEGMDQLHEYTGYAIVVLVGLRIVWGLIGSRHARFAYFIFKPSSVIAYMKDILYKRAKRYLGHNPAGGAMVLALLLALLAVVGTGVLSITDMFRGMEWVKGLHEGAANVILGLVVLHIAGVVLASIQHRENLVRSMFDGLKRRDD